MLSDVAGFAVSLFASWAVTRRSHASYSFGYHRIEILGALASVLTIWAVTGALVWEAVSRILNPEPVDGKRKWSNPMRNEAAARPWLPLHCHLRTQSLVTSTHTHAREAGCL